MTLPTISSQHKFLQKSYRTPGGTDYRSLEYGSASLVVIDDYGNIGVRTTSPESTLHIKDAISAITIEGSASSALITKNTGEAANEKYVQLLHDAGIWKLQGLSDALATTFTFLSGDLGDGNVGIGTATPVLNAQVHGTYENPDATGAPDNGILRLSQSAGAVVMDFGIGPSDPGGWIQAYLSSDATSVYPLKLNPNGGKVGIGTLTPVGKLGVNLASASGSTGAWDSTYAVFGDASAAGGEAVGIGFDSVTKFGEIRSIDPGSSWEDLRIRGKEISLWYQNASGTSTRGVTLEASSGEVGIGTATPATKLQVGAAFTAGAMPTAANTNAVWAAVDKNDATSQPTALFGQRQANVSGSVQGLEGYAVSNNASGSIALSGGLFAYAQHTGAGTLADGRGVTGGMLMLAGAGPVTRGVGALFSSINNSSSTLTYGIGVEIQVSGSGTITTAYGVYINAATAGSTKWGIYQAGGSDNNYFAGNIGINTTSFASGSAVLSIGNTAAAPSTALSNAAIIFVASSKLKSRENDGVNRYIVQATSATKVTAGAPYTNDGYVTVRINGTDIKVMTTA